MKNEEFLRLCKAKVAEYTNSHMDKTDGKQIAVQDVYVVWSCKTLQNSKALLSYTLMLIRSFRTCALNCNCAGTTEGR